MICTVSPNSADLSTWQFDFKSDPTDILNVQISTPILKFSIRRLSSVSILYRKVFIYFMKYFTR